MIATAGQGAAVELYWRAQVGLGIIRPLNGENSHARSVPRATVSG
jgi:hypothetical protein